MFLWYQEVEHVIEIHKTQTGLDVARLLIKALSFVPNIFHRVIMYETKKQNENVAEKLRTPNDSGACFTIINI